MRTPSDVRGGAAGHDVVVPTNPDGPGRRREETAVISLTDLDNRRADHAARVARADREGWLRDAQAAGARSRQWGAANGVGSVRRHLGGALVRAGMRLQGPPVAHAADPAAA
jgi:hypothetical protein